MSPPPGTAPLVISPLAAWFPDARAIETFRRRRLGRAATVLAPGDDAWTAVVPGFAEAVDMAASGLPFQIAADRRYDRSGDRRRLRRALAEGKTVYLPQVHQVLPRLARLMVALRAAFLGPFRDECSFLFLVEGRGRPAMGLHHDGDVESFWLQIEGRRTVTTGPPVAPGVPEDLDQRPARGARGWTTRDLEPGSLFYMPPRTPHGVVCHVRSLAVSLTWKPPDVPEALAALLDGAADGTASKARLAPPPMAAAGGATAAFRRLLGEAARQVAAAVRDPRLVARVYAAGMLEWDVADGRVTSLPDRSRDRLWTQVPVVAGPTDGRRRRFPLWTADDTERWLPARLAGLARELATMPSVAIADLTASERGELTAGGILLPYDLPQRIVPADPGALDGWRFA